MQRCRRAAADVGASVTHFTDEQTGVIDDWGRDPGLVRSAMGVSRLRWDVTVGGDQHLPRRKGALIVVNARWLALAPIFSALALSEAVDRPVRFVGRPDAAPVGAFLRRIGALLDHPDEVAGALAAGELVIMGAAHDERRRKVGRVDHALVGGALAAGVQVFPAATSSSPIGRARSARDRLAVSIATRRRGPLGELELADQVGSDIETLLAEMGDIRTGTPLDWLPLERARRRLMTYVRSTDGTRIHYRITGRPSGAPGPVHPGPRRRQARLGPAAARDRAVVPRASRSTTAVPAAATNRTAPYSLEQMADDAIAVLDHAGVETAHVVGASMGGAISQIIAVKYPERTRSLTLACTAGRNHPWREELLAELARHRTRARDRLR